MWTGCADIGGSGSPKRKCARRAEASEEVEEPDAVIECTVPLLCAPQPLLANSDICRCFFSLDLSTLAPSSLMPMPTSNRLAESTVSG